MRNTKIVCFSPAKSFSVGITLAIIMLALVAATTSPRPKMFLCQEMCRVVLATETPGAYRSLPLSRLAGRGRLPSLMSAVR